MSSAPRLYLTNASAVLEDRMAPRTSVTLLDGRIEAIGGSAPAPPFEEVDLDGELLLPGLIDLHSDAIEVEAEPRPGVLLPFEHVARQVDRKSAAAGITTPFHALSFAGPELGLRSHEQADALARVVAALGRRALVDNRVHCRYEVTHPDSLARIRALVEDGICTLVSFMDHSPGQGQFHDESSFRQYLGSRYGYDDAELDRIVTAKRGKGADTLAALEALAVVARARGVALASHDDDAPSRVATLLRLGVGIAEFPLNAATALALRSAGLHVSVGSPNVLRGGSQSSGMRALELLAAGSADCLCSDYAPATLLPAVFHAAGELGGDLAAAVRLATAAPAHAAKLEDRGAIAPGLRADLIAVRRQDGSPVVGSVWVAGRPVLRVGG